MTPFETMRLPEKATVVAPDGSHVRILLSAQGGSMAHFELRSGKTSIAVVHRTVEEIWYVVSGSGQMWRKNDDGEEIVKLEPGVCLTIPLGTQFQFRASTYNPLAAIAITMPPWPGPDEAVVVEGPWTPTTWVTPARE